MRLPWLFVVTFCKFSVNPITNLNTFYSQQSYTWQYVSAQIFLQYYYLIICTFILFSLNHFCGLFTTLAKSTYSIEWKNDKRILNSKGFGRRRLWYNWRVHPVFYWRDRETQRKPQLFSQNYWVFGLSPSSSILENRKHNFSETGSVSSSGEGGRHLLSWGP
jgi:hypothetical protein